MEGEPCARSLSLSHTHTHTHTAFKRNENKIQRHNNCSTLQGSLWDDSPYHFSAFKTVSPFSPRLHKKTSLTLSKYCLQATQTQRAPPQRTRVSSVILLWSGLFWNKARKPHSDSPFSAKLKKKKKKRRKKCFQKLLAHTHSQKVP